MSEQAKLLPCPFCGGAMQPRDALWPSEGDTDGIIHASPTDCPLPEFSVGIADDGASVAAAWNKRAALMGVERAALQPLRAREEIARGCDEQPIGATLRQWIEAIEALPGTSWTDAALWNGGCITDDLKVAADEIDRLSRTAGQEWRDISSAAEAFRIAVIESGALNHVRQDTYFSQLRALETALAALPAPPVAKPIVAEKSEVKS